MKNKTLFYIFFIFTLLNVIDIITSLFILPGEGNPIYNLTGQLWILILIKIGIVYIIWKWYNRNIYTSKLSFYILLNIILYGCVVLLIAQVTNIYGILNPSVVEASSNLTPQQRSFAYFYIMNIIYIIPIIFNIIVFILYNKAKKQTTFNKEELRKLKWWQV